MNSDIRITVTHLDFRKIGAEMAAAIDDEVNKSANQIVGNAVLAIQNPPKTGATYKHGKIVHQASAPGEAPATDTGNLAGSGTVRRVGLAHYQCVFSTPYARALEFGNPSGTILPRPYLRPAVQKEEPVLRANIAKAMGKGG